MYFLTSKMSDKDIAEIQRMIPRRDFVDKWKHLESGAHDLAKKLTGKEAATAVGSVEDSDRRPRRRTSCFSALTTRQQAVDQKIKNFFGKWRQVKEKLPFPEMAELRITPSFPSIRRLTDKAFLLLLDGKLRSHNEIVNFLKPYEPPPPPPPPAPKRGRGKAAAAAAGRRASTCGCSGEARAQAEGRCGSCSTGGSGNANAAASGQPQGRGEATPAKAATKAAPPAKAAAKKAPPKLETKQLSRLSKKPAAKKAAPAKKVSEESSAEEGQEAVEVCGRHCCIAETVNPNREEPRFWWLLLFGC